MPPEGKASLQALRDGTPELASYAPVRESPPQAQAQQHAQPQPQEGAGLWQAEEGHCSSSVAAAAGRSRGVRKGKRRLPPVQTMDSVDFEALMAGKRVCQRTAVMAKHGDHGQLDAGWQAIGNAGASMDSVAGKFWGSEMLAGR